MNKRTQLPHGGPQLGPVLALQALLTEHPELPLLSWTLNREGYFTGSLHNTAPLLNDLPGVDPRAVIAAYAEVLDGEVSEPNPFNHEGKVLVSQHVNVVWRDVEMHIAVYFDSSAYPQLNASQAVAA